MARKRLWIGGCEQEQLGPLWAACSTEGLVALFMRAREPEVRRALAEHELFLDQERVAPILEQLQEYFRGQRRAFDVPFDWSLHSPFQARVLHQVCQIPYGETRTYQEIADAIGEPGAARAVGRANATNPMAPIIPCHRVLGSDGGLHGYGGPGGVETKAWLLRLEGSRLL